MKRFGIMYGNKGRRKMRSLFDDEFTRNMHAAANKAMGFRVRKFTRKAASTKAIWK